MTIAASISSWDIGSFRNEVRGFDVKTKNAYLELTLQLRLRGTLPFEGDAAEAGGRYLGVLARIADVTKRFWRDTAWPLLCDLFVVQDGRLSHPGIERAPATARKAMASEPAKEKDPVRVKAANVRWHPDASSPDANVHGESMQTDAQLDAKSTVSASEKHANVHLFASDTPLAPKPTLPSSPFSQPTESLTGSEEVSVGEVGVTRASAGASDMQTTMQTDANDHAKPHAKPHANGLANGHAKPPANRPPGRTRMTEDWQPAAAVALVCANIIGCDLAETLEAFRDHFLASGETKLDWNAALRGWCRRKMEFDAQRRQIPLVRSIATTRPDKDAWKLDEARAIYQRRAVGAGAGDGPIIDAEAD